MQTYDYSSHRGVPGPEAPITWMDIVVSSLVPAVLDEDEELEEGAAILRGKILLGIPFYGCDGAQSRWSFGLSPRNCVTVLCVGC
jgi:hypothetical protein